MALFIQELQDDKTLDFDQAEGNENRMVTVSAATAKLKPNEYNGLITCMYEKAFTRNAWMDKKPVRS